MSKTRIWLEVSNVRKEGPEVSVQLKGDRKDPGPEWWEVQMTKATGGSADPKETEESSREVFREISSALDKKWTVIAGLTSSGKGKSLYVDLYRIQLADTTSY